MKKSAIKSIKHKLCLQGVASVGFVLILSGIYFPATAQRDTTRKLKEVQISSPAAPRAQTIVPSQQITNADFKNYAAFSVADIASTFAGVNLKDYGGIGGLKTISVRSLGANHTGVLYDGVQINDAQNGQIDLGKFTLYNIQAITLYNGQAPNVVQPARSFASASILDIKTIKPNLSINKPFKITAGVNAGSFSLINPYLQWQQRINSQWNYILNANYTGANGRYKYKVNGDGSDTLATRKNSDVKSIQTDGALYWAKSDSSKFKVQFNYNHNSQGLPGAVIYYTSASSQRIKNEDLLVRSVYDYTAKSSFHLLVNGKYSQNYLNYTDPNFLNNSGGINEHYTQHEFYTSASIGYHLLPNWEVAYSTDAVVTNLFSDVYKYAFPTRISLFNAFATDLSLNKWHFQANLLNTYITESVKSGTAAAARSVFSPTVSASFQPLQTANFQLRAFYKDVFRNPTFAEQYYYATVPRSIRPERVKQYDLGVTYQKSYDGILRDIAITADVYYNNVTDKIIYLATRSPQIPSVTNLGKVDIKGMDVTIKSTFTPAKGWGALLSANYTYQNAIDVTNPSDSYYLDQIPYTPKSLVNVNAGVSRGQLGLYYNATVSTHRYYSSDNTEAYYVPGYGVSNASLVYNFLWKSKLVNASFEANNLFNNNYAIIRSYPMPGRSFRINMQITI